MTHLDPDTHLPEGEHSISYAYPSSQSACSFGRDKTGCYIARRRSAAVAVDSYAEAVNAAGEWGTRPQRWSMDHPANARFLPRA